MVVVLEYNPITDDDVPQILHDLLDAVATSPTKQASTYVAIAEAADRVVAEFKH